MPRRLFSAPLVFFFAAGIGVAQAKDPPVKAEPPTKKELQDIFKPDRTDRVAIAPDGRHLAYTVRQGDGRDIGIVDLERPLGKPTFLPVGDLQYLHWASADTLVYANSLEARAVGLDGKPPRLVADSTLAPISGDISPEFQSFPDPDEDGDGVPDEPDAAADAAAAAADPDNVVPRAPIVVFGAPGGDPGSLLVQFDVNNDRPQNTRLYRVNVATGQGRLVAYETKGVGLPPVKKGRFLTDQQGRPRLLPTSWLNQRNYLYRGAERFTAWRDLDRFIRPDLTARFDYVDKSFYRDRAVPLAFDRDPRVLYVASNVGTDTYGIYGLNLETRKFTDLQVSLPFRDLIDPSGVSIVSPLVFDHDGTLLGVRIALGGTSAKWLEPRMDAIQRALDRAFPARRAEILDWDNDRKHVVALVSSPSDAGRYIVFEPDHPNRSTEILRMAPGLSGAKVNVTERFEFTTADGIVLSGTLTMPHRPTIDPPALLVFCRDIPGAFAGQDPRMVQALAAMGFAVAQVDYRGSTGYGKSFRNAPLAALDRVPLDDIRAAIGWIGANRKVSAGRVGLVGEGFGGYIAVRGLELFPEAFQCAVAINAPSDPEAWMKEPHIRQGPHSLVEVDDIRITLRRAFFGDANFSGLSARAGARTLKRPVFILADTSKDSVDLWKSQGTGLRDAIKRAGGDVEYLAVDADFSSGDVDARTAAFLRVGDFLTTAMYEYSVDVGPTRVVR